MSNYVQSTNFATKDALASGDPLKIVKGTEINTEFNNIATAVATKADSASPTFTGTVTIPTLALTNDLAIADGGTGASTAAGAATNLAAEFGKLLFPVGAIYTAVVSTNPGTLLGFGTWTAFGAGRVMVGFDSGNTLFDTAEETGGSANATLPSHTHTASTATAGDHNHVIETYTATDQFVTNTRVSASGTSAPYAGQYTTNTAGAHAHSVTVDSAGSSGTNANYQPYITVYMWKRTA